MKVFLKETKVKITVMVLTAAIFFWFIPVGLLFADDQSGQDANQTSLIINETTLQDEQTDTINLTTGNSGEQSQNEEVSENSMITENDSCGTDSIVNLSQANNIDYLKEDPDQNENVVTIATVDSIGQPMSSTIIKLTTNGFSYFKDEFGNKVYEKTVTTDDGGLALVSIFADRNDLNGNIEYSDILSAYVEINNDADSQQNLSLLRDVDESGTLTQANQMPQQMLSLFNGGNAGGNILAQDNTRQVLSGDLLLDESTGLYNQNPNAANDDPAGLNLNTGSDLSGTQSRLSSGMRINSASDDAAGLVQDIGSIISGAIAFLEHQWRLPGTINIHNTDAVDGKDLSSAVFNIYTEDGINQANDAWGNLLNSGETDSYGNLASPFTGLSWGTYIIREVSAPDGYGLADDITVMIPGYKEADFDSRQNLNLLRDADDSGTLSLANQMPQQILSLFDGGNAGGSILAQDDTPQVLSGDLSLDESEGLYNQNPEDANDDPAGLNLNTGSSLSKTQSRLSSGLRINSAADDAANLNIIQNEIAEVDIKLEILQPRLTAPQTEESQFQDYTANQDSIVKQDPIMNNDSIISTNSSIITDSPENAIDVAALQEFENQKVSVLAYTGLAPVVPVAGMAAVLMGAIFIILSLTGNNKKCKHVSRL